MQFSNWGKWLTKISVIVTILPQIIQIIGVLINGMGSHPVIDPTLANGISGLGAGGMAMGIRRGTVAVEKKTALLLEQQPNGIPVEEQDHAIEKMEGKV